MTFPHSRARQDRLDLNQLGQAGEIAVLAADRFDASDLTEIAGAAERAGYRTVLLSPAGSLVAGRTRTGEDMNFVVDGAPGDRSASDFAGLLAPAGAQSVAQLQEDQDARLFLGEFVKSGAPICALGEAVAMLADASGKTGVDGDAALALNGDVFTAQGEDARADARAMFIKSMTLAKSAA